MIRGVAAGLLAMAAMATAQAVSTTTVQGTVYLANGQPGAGTLAISWPAFTTAAGQSVAADSTTVTIGADGFVSVNLAPNVGATPSGEYYTAVYYMSDGTTSTQYWVVPAAAQASLAEVQAQVMPAAQAVQAVSKAYVDQAIAGLSGGSGLSATGGTLTGPLILSGDPTQPLQAADKHYVDTQVATAVPLAGGNMTGALTTPTVNGVQAPAAGSAQTTLQAAMNAAGTNGAMAIPPNYAGTDRFTNASGVKVTDLRTSVAQQAERSVKEFGAVCDGVTDDTNALQAALSYANAHGVALTIPQGTCKTRTLSWHGESIGGLGKQVSALMGFPGEDVLVSGPDAVNMLSYTRLHDLTIYVDQSMDVSCTPSEGRAAGGTCEVSRPVETNSIFSPGGNGLTETAGSGAAWSVGNCAIAMQAATGAGGNGLRVAEMENVEIAATGADPMAAQYPGAHSTHTCGLYLAQWPQWSEFRNIDIRGLNTGVAIPALPATAPAGLNADSNRWQNVTIQATHAFTAAAGSNNVLDNVAALAGNSSATGEPPTGLVLDLDGNGQNAQEGWTVRNAVVIPAWNAVPPALTVTAAGGAVTAVTLGSEHGLGWDPYGTSVPVAFSGSCTAQATAAVNANGSIASVTVTQGGVGCSATTTASLNAAGTWDTAAPVNLIGGQNMTFFAGNLLKGNGGYTVWNAGSSASYGTQLDSGGGTLPGGGAYAALVGSSRVGAAFQVDQFPGADIGAKMQACVNAVNATYGGTCDARNFTGNLTMGENLTISTGNVAILLPCATITTANQIVVTAGTRNAALRGCALRGGSEASGGAGGTVFAYTGSGAMVQVGDPTYATDTPGFHLDNAVINTTGATSATAQGFIAYRTQELNLESLYFLGNSNQTGITLDGTGNYTGGTFLDNEISGFGTAVNAIGHQVTNPTTTDWMNASTFVRLHIDCPTSGGNPIGGTYGINLQQGDGNTFTGGDVEGCSTALHLGPNAQNNTIVGLRNENSTSQVVADTGSAYNNWITGGTMFTGKLTDNGTRNSFLDTFHRSFNALNGDWYESQQDATVTNHWRLGAGAGNERGLLNEIQTDYGYRWLEGFSDATSGEQFYQLDDLLNNVYRITVGQYLSSTANVVTNVTLSSGGCYSSNAAPTLSISGGGGSGAAGTANMTTSKCSGGYTVGSVTMTSNGSGYTSQPTISWSGGNPISAPNAIAEITTAGSTNDETALNAAGTGNVCFNCSTNSGTGGVTFASGGATPAAVATVDKAGDAQFVGNLLVGGTTQSAGTFSLRNSADAEVDYYLWPGLTTSQKGSFTYKDWNGNSQWYLVKDASNNWALNSAIGGLDSFKAYQSTNTGDTYVDANNSTGHVRFNYETGSGTETDIYSGSSTNLDAAFLAPNAIKFPGLAASSGDFCLQIDNSGYITNTGSACGTGSGSGGVNGTINSASSGQIAYYTANGTAIGGMSAAPLAAGGTGATSANGALANLGGQLTIPVTAYGAVGNCTTSGAASGCTDNTSAIQAAINAAYANGNAAVFLPKNQAISGAPTVYYVAGTLNPKGVNIYGALGSGLNANGVSPVGIRGAPGKDVFAPGDPSSPGYVTPNTNFAWQDFGIIVDDSEDVSASFPHRRPGRVCSDVTATNASAVITSATCEFQQGDAGQSITLSDGTNTLSTTIASVAPPATALGSATATLAAAWTYSTHTNSILYVSLMGLPTTATIGNCALAYDDTATTTDGSGPDNSAFENIYISTVSGARQNNSCGLFFQGVAGQPYDTKFDHVGISGTQWGFVAALSDAAGSGINAGLGDLNEFNSLTIGSTYSWVSYDGEWTRWIGGQLYSTKFAPQILGYNATQEIAAADWFIDGVETESQGQSGSGSGWRISGANHIVRNTTLGDDGVLNPVQWDAFASKCTNCYDGGPINVTGKLNQLEFVSADQIAVNDTGFGNQCSLIGETNLGNVVGFSLPHSCSATNSRQTHAFAHTSDFVANGDELTPYNNQADLWIWPEDLAPVDASANLVADSSSETGSHYAVPEGLNEFIYLNQAPITVGPVTSGANLPATKVHVCWKAKADSGSGTVDFWLYAESTLVVGISASLTTSYSTSCGDADLTSYSGQAVTFQVYNPTVQTDLAWITVHPWAGNINSTGTVNAAGFDVSGSPLATGNLADWTDSGAANGSVPMWNATTSKWTPGTLPSNASTINGGAVPPSATVVGTNSSGQPVSAVTTGSGSVVLATSPSLSALTVSGTLAGASETLSGTLSVTGTQTLTGATTMQGNVTLVNGANANQTLAIQPGSSADQIGAVQFNNYSGTAEWQVRKDASNYLRVTDAVNALDRVILPANANTTINAGAGANAVVINNTSGAGTGGFIVYEGGSNYSTAALQVSGSGNTTATGYLQGKFIMGTGTMGVAAGAAAGSGPTIACATSHICDGVSGTVTLTTGTSPTTGTLATLSFPNTHSNQASCMVTTLSATGMITSNTWTESTTAITITANTALTASTAYTIKYWCGGY